MTRKDLDKIICTYFDLLIENKSLEQSIGNGKKIEPKDIAQLLISSVAKNTRSSSNIWVCIGTINQDTDKSQRYYYFVDLERCLGRYIPSLEYGEFCRTNTVIILEKYFEKFRKEFVFGIEGFNTLRNNYIIELSSYLLNSSSVNIEDFSNHYNRIVTRYKKDGELTLEPISFTRR